MINNNRGFIMVLTMIVLVVLTVLGIGGLMISGFQQDIAGRLRCRMNSLQCADAGRAIVLSRYQRPSEIMNYPFPLIVDTSIPGVCDVIFSGHLPDIRTEAGNISTYGVRGGGFCTNNVGCESGPGGGGANYVTTVVARAENCSPVEVEFAVNVGF
jgi:hypothetical protein